MTHSTTLSIFKAGQHVDSQGQSIHVDADTLEQLANSYDAKRHEAPLVIGHPKDDAPAYGWVKSLRLANDQLQAEISDVHPNIAEMIRNGAFRKLSSSFYPADSALNPTPGQLSLRHIGLLGAQPPAVKGLPNIEFADYVPEVIHWTRDIEITPIKRFIEWLTRILDQAGPDELQAILQPMSSTSNQTKKHVPGAQSSVDGSDKALINPKQTLSQAVQTAILAAPAVWSIQTLGKWIEQLQGIQKTYLSPISEDGSDGVSATTSTTAANIAAVEFSEMSAQPHIASSYDASIDQVSQLITQAHRKVADAHAQGHGLSFAEAVTLAQQETPHA